MLFNHDMCDVIADVELLGHIKTCQWPKHVHTFKYILSPKDKFTITDMTLLIKMDAAYGRPEVALWFAINDKHTDPHTYVCNLSLPLLYNNGFITKLPNPWSILQDAMSRREVSIEVLTIITKLHPDLYTTVFERAITYKSPEVIKWLYATKPSSISTSLSKLIEINATAEIMAFYKSIYPQWLSGANEIIMREISNNALVYNNALRWLIKETGFDIKSLVANGEFMQDMLRRVYYMNCVETVSNIMADFRDVIEALSPERLESIVTMIYEKNNSEYFGLFMRAITAKLPARVIMNHLHSQELLKKLYTSGRISGDFKSVEGRIFADYDDWYPSNTDDEDDY